MSTIKQSLKSYCIVSSNDGSKFDPHLVQVVNMKTCCQIIITRVMLVSKQARPTVPYDHVIYD